MLKRWLINNTPFATKTEMKKIIFLKTAEHSISLNPGHKFPS